MAGFAGKEPLVMVMKLLIVMTPPAGIVNGETNAGVWTKEVTFVPPLPPLPPVTIAGFIATPRDPV